MTTKPTHEDLEQKVKELEKETVEQKQTVEALQESEEKYRTLFENSRDAISISTQDGKYIAFNQSFLDLFGYTEEEALQSNAVERYLNPIDRVRFMKEVDEKGSVQDYELMLRKVNGEEMITLCSATLRRAPDGSILGYQSVVRDITQKRKTVEELQESEAQKKAILDASIDRIRLVDTDMRIIWANKTTTRELHMAPEDLRGKFCYQVFVGRDTPCSECPTKKALTSGTLEHAIMHKHASKSFKGETHWDNYSIPIKNESGDIENLIQITRNITEQVQAEKALREREKELKIQATNLKEVITALRVVLKRRDEDKTELEEKILSNVKDLVVPFLEKVKKTPLDSKQFTYIDILESNLNDITSPFLHNLSTKYINLTPKEIKVAYLIKEGKTTKEIGEMMTVSPRTIETHRKNMRKKLGMEKKKGNLRSRLLTFQ